LTALSRVYGRVALLRRAWYERHPDRLRRLSRPVISVGNLASGGSGKTPIVAALAQLLLEHGERPAILSRGYGRRRVDDGVVVVSNGAQVLADAERSGDEPQMLARALPGIAVMVAADRYLAGTLAERRFGCTVHLLDDGFQHVQLARTIDLLAVSRADLQDRVVPAGRLREPLEAASGADAVLVAGDDEDAREVESVLHPRAVFRVVPRYQDPRFVQPFGEAMQVNAMQANDVPANGTRRVVAVAAIARPERFFAALRAKGWDVAREMTFRDHHWFTAKDLKKVSAAAEETGASLVMTTEKDAMRLGPLVGRGLAPRQAGREGAPYAYLPMSVTIEPGDRFASWLRERLAA
jgi:tetraacyldisaccharide 4'-kinase